MKANLYVFRIILKRCSFAGSVNDPIDDTENVAGERLYIAYATRSGACRER